MLKVKICGITNLEDALLAEKLGADMLGFIFHGKSPRFAHPAKVARIVAALSPLTRKVGVFVNEPVEEVLRMAEKLEFDFVQLAGEEGDAYVKKIQKQFPVIKAFRIGEDFRPKVLQKSPALLTLADAKVNGCYGGSGKSFDWRKLTALKGNARLVLAGGIGAENLRQAYEVLQPAAVDLTSSVEERPGKKDAAKMKRFFEVANEIRFGR
ncbi:MAG TPA: phosphoribosylanthranilate isomerase [Verrucomicrobiae bacterium]|nr:phosphoribosylanthranilate isomerase [Verrucomicrobiae bacterium]